MKKRFALSLSTVIITLLFLAGCGDNAEPFETNAVAYPLNTEQMKAENLSASTDIYPENVLSYKNDANETILRIYSAPIEDSENAISHNTGGDYSGDGKFMQKTFPVIWSADNPVSVTHGSNFAEITPITSDEYTAEQKGTINIFVQI